jgi:hypothetical protein
MKVFQFFKTFIKHSNGHKTKYNNSKRGKSYFDLKNKHFNENFLNKRKINFNLLTNH